MPGALDLSKVNLPAAGLLVAGVGAFVWILRSNEMSRKDRRAFGKAMLATGATAGAWWYADKAGYVASFGKWLTPQIKR